MDATVKLLLDKVTQLTNKFNSMTLNSKKIHELINTNIQDGLFIAVSDGDQTFKTEYKPSEVSPDDIENLLKMALKADLNIPSLYIEDFKGNVLTTLDISFITEDSVKYTPQTKTPQEQQTARENIKAAFADDVSALQGLQFESDQANATLTIKDGNGLVLTTISLMYLNNEVTKFIYNPTTQELELWNDQGDLLSSVPVSAFVSNLASNANWNGTTPSKLDFKDNTGVVLFSIDYSISNIQGLTAALAGKANTTGNYPNLTVGKAELATLWGGAEYNNSVSSNIGNFLVYDPSDYCYHPADVSVVKNTLGINDINWNQAYNERVTQFNTTYTTSVYTFSLLLGNGVTKSTNLQVGTSYFTIDSNGVLQLNNAIAQKINNSATQTYVDNKVASIPPQRRYNLNDTNNNDLIEGISKLDSFPISGLEVVVFDALTSQFENPLVVSDFKDSFMSICGLLVDNNVIIKGLVGTTSDLTSLINSGKFHLCMAYANTGSIYSGTIEWMSSQDIYMHRKGTTAAEIKDIIKIVDIVSPNSVFVNPKNI